MLKTLSIKNYALIKNIQIHFNAGFTAITGETGAGKSIILGAMHLMLGQRADSSAFQNSNEKCIAEGTFTIHKYNLKAFFEENELDYWEETILRREVLPSGKTRAFVNDTPVTLQVLKSIASKLIDIHSQSQNSEIEDKAFQLDVIDANAGLLVEREQYRVKYDNLVKLDKELEAIKNEALRAKSEQEFLQYQYEKLEEARLNINEENELEEEQNLLSHAGEIKAALSNIETVLHNDETGIILQLSDAIKAAAIISPFLPKAIELNSRLESVKIELEDIFEETEQLNENTEFDPSRLEYINDRLSLLFSLKQKHQVSTIEELIQIKASIEEKLLESDNLDQSIKKLEKQKAALQTEILQFANKLSEKRKKTFTAVEKYVQERLGYLGMMNARLTVESLKLNKPGKNGIDDIRFLFSANKNQPLQDLALVASGGEKSRLMLTIKSLLAENKNLPTIIFDEIDTGISGDIAQKLAQQLSYLAKNMQMIVITHLPQVASKGNQHMKVFKEENNDGTSTSIKTLDDNARVLEIAEMLSGKNPSEAAILNAIELLKN